MRCAGPCLRLLLVHVARVEGGQGVGQGIREIFQFLIEILQSRIAQINGSAKHGALGCANCSAVLTDVSEGYVSVTVISDDISVFVQTSLIYVFVSLNPSLPFWSSHLLNICVFRGLLHVSHGQIVGILSKGLIDLLCDVEQGPEGGGNDKNNNPSLSMGWDGRPKS